MKLKAVKEETQKEWEKRMAETRQKWYRDDTARCFG
jgi:hypothetical protein